MRFPLSLALGLGYLPSVRGWILELVLKFIQTAEADVL